MSQALVDYTLDFYHLRDFEQDYAPLLARYKQLQNNLAESEAALKEHARVNGPEENDTVTVSVQQKVKRWYHADTMLARAPWLAQVPNIITLDTKRVENLIKAGAIPADLVAEAIRTEDMTPAVSVRVKVPEVTKAEVPA